MPALPLGVEQAQTALNLAITAGDWDMAERAAALLHDAIADELSKRSGRRVRRIV